MNEEIILKSNNGVGIITLNRPERLNALTYNIVQKMNDFLDKCESYDDIKEIAIKSFDPILSGVFQPISFKSRKSVNYYFLSGISRIDTIRYYLKQK